MLVKPPADFNAGLDPEAESLRPWRAKESDVAESIIGDFCTGTTESRTRALLRWRIAILVSAAIAISYLDRQTLPVAVHAIAKDIPLSNQQFSALQSAFLLSYALMYAGGGKLADALGTRRGFAVIMTFWSLANASHALAAGFGMLMGAGFCSAWEKAEAFRRLRGRLRNGFPRKSAPRRWESSTPARPWARLSRRR